MKLLDTLRNRWPDSRLAWAFFGGRETGDRSEEPPSQADLIPFAMEQPAITPYDLTPRVPVLTVTFLMDEDGSPVEQEGPVYDARAAFMYWAMQFDVIFEQCVERAKEVIRQAAMDTWLWMNGQIPGSLLSRIIVDRARIFAYRPQLPRLSL